MKDSNSGERDFVILLAKNLTLQVKTAAIIPPLTSGKSSMMDAIDDWEPGDRPEMTDITFPRAGTFLPEISDRMYILQKMENELCIEQ